VSTNKQNTLSKRGKHRQSQMLDQPHTHMLLSIHTHTHTHTHTHGRHVHFSLSGLFPGSGSDEHGAAPTAVVGRFAGGFEVPSGRTGTRGGRTGSLDCPGLYSSRSCADLRLDMLVPGPLLLSQSFFNGQDRFFPHLDRM
jgi:hypothetical protein